MASSHLAGLLVAASFSLVAAEPPTLKHPYPAAGARGTTVNVTVGGKIDPWPSQVWVDGPGIVFKPAKTKNQFDVEIAGDAAMGAHLFRVYNESGASAPRIFIVSDKAEGKDTEPNDGFRTPQKVEKLPVTINGKLNKGEDVDSYAVSLKAGETLAASLQAYVLMSTFDGLLRVVDEQGMQVAFNHDDGRTLDPALNWKAPHDGTYIVQVMGFVYPATSSVGLTGGEGCVYRLRLGLATPAQPTPREGTALSLPGEVFGCIDRAGEEDRFTFSAIKQRTYEFRLAAVGEGSLLDAWMRIDGKDGKQLVSADDADGSREPKLVWKAPADGEYALVVGEVTHRGGPAYTYQIRAEEASPKVTGNCTTDSFVVKPEQPAEAKVAVKRTNGFKSKLKLSAKNLPEGVSAAEVDVPEKDGEVALKITATAEAKAAGLPIQLVLRESEGGIEHIVRHFLTTTGENNGVPQGYRALAIDSTDQLWLTVIAPPPKPDAAKESAEKPKADAPKTEAK